MKRSGECRGDLRLGSLVGTFFQLSVMTGLLSDVQDLLGQSLIGDGPSSIWFGHCSD